MAAVVVMTTTSWHDRNQRAAVDRDNHVVSVDCWMLIMWTARVMCGRWRSRGQRWSLAGDLALMFIVAVNTSRPSSTVQRGARPPEMREFRRAEAKPEHSEQKSCWFSSASNTVNIEAARSSLYILERSYTLPSTVSVFPDLMVMWSDIDDNHDDTDDNCVFSICIMLKPCSNDVTYGE